MHYKLMAKHRDESSKDQMSPENITEHEPTAVKRNPKDQQIVEGGQTGADTPEAREKLRKSGMTKV
jgi:hypothetical protein